MAQLWGAADEPGNFLGLNAVKLAQENSKPKGGGHDIVGHADAFSSEIRQTGDAGGGADVKAQPDKRLGWKDRQRRPIPAIAFGLFARDEILGKRHFKDIKLIVLEITEKQFRRRRDDGIEMQLRRFDGSVDERFETRILGQSDFDFQHNSISTPSNFF